MTWKYDLLNIAIAVNISQPKGGVAEPVNDCKVTIVPTKTGSIPSIITTGLNIGVKIIITTIGSTNMQPIKNAPAITNNTHTWVGLEPIIAVKNLLGILNCENTPTVTRSVNKSISFKLLDI